MRDCCTNNAHLNTANTAGATATAGAAAGTVQASVRGRLEASARRGRADLRRDDRLSLHAGALIEKLSRDHLQAVFTKHQPSRATSSSSASSGVNGAAVRSFTAKLSVERYCKLFTILMCAMLALSGSLYVESLHSAIAR